MNIPSFFATPGPSFGSRREFLRRTGQGCGLLALLSLFKSGSASAAEMPDRRLQPLGAQPSHTPARARSVIWLFMNGGQSQVDTWDYKPELAKRDGQDLPGFDKNTGFFTAEVGPLMKSPFQFKQHGRSGTWVSEIFPRLTEHVDD